MKRLFKMLSLLSILLILGSCDSSKRVIGIENTVPDGKIAIIVAIDRASFMGTMALSPPNQFNTDIDVSLENLSLGTRSTPVSLNQSMIVDIDSKFKLTGNYDLVAGGFREFTPREFTARVDSNNTRTLLITIKADIAVIGGTSTIIGTVIRTTPI